MDRPILFNAEMVRAVLDGRKTQTRRVVKPQPIMVTDNGIEPWEGTGPGLLARFKQVGVKCPYGAPGDRLWVRETWVRETWMIHGESFSRPACEISYRANNKTAVKKVPAELVNKYLEKIGDQYHPNEHMQMCHADETGTLNWRPSIHMPRWASRITLEVVSVRVERLQEITLKDICAEGLAETIYDFKPVTAGLKAWATLWDSIAKPGYGWDSNCWVWVVEFKRIAP